MNKISKLLFTVLVVSCVWISGQTVAAEADKSNKQQDVAELYLKNCSICHGDRGDAQTRTTGMDPRPRDFTTAEAAMELTRERMIDAVTNGRPGTAMVAHKGRLSEEQIASLVDYIRANFMRVPVAEQTGIPEAVSLGEKVYTKNCSVCHGDKGNTAFWAKNGLNPPPKDFTSPESMSDLNKKRMIQSVTHGRPGTGMMPFKTRLSTEEIAAVVGFIRYKFMGVDPDKDTGAAPLAQVAKGAHPMPKSPEPTSPHAGGIPGVDSPLSTARPSTPDSQQRDPHQRPQAHAPQTPPPDAGISPGMMGGHEINVDMSEAIPNNLTADVNWGREFYMKNCFTCHGVKGDGQGPRAYFNRPPPRDFTSSASRQILNRPRIYDSITRGRVGTVMPAWGKVLTDQEIANLTEFVFQAFIKGKGAGEAEKTSNIGTDEKVSDKKKAS